MSRGANLEPATGAWSTESRAEKREGSIQHMSRGPDTVGLALASLYYIPMSCLCPHGCQQIVLHPLWCPSPQPSPPFPIGLETGSDPAPAQHLTVHHWDGGFYTQRSPTPPCTHHPIYLCAQRHVPMMHPLHHPRVRSPPEPENAVSEPYQEY